MGGTVLAFAVLAAAAFTILPKRADAFWPFSNNADAAANSSLMPSASTPVLIASTNSNPNIRMPVALPTSGDSALIAYGGPSGSMSDLAGSATSGRISVYVVRPGDTLSEIADMFDVSVNTIKWANDLSSTSVVRPGDTLIILPVSGLERTVAKGDTLKSIAKKYGADADEIAKFNGLDPSAPLAVGSTIIIPGGEIAPTPPPAKTSRKKLTTTQPYRGGGGSAQPGYYGNPLPGALITQGIHGWNGVDFGAPRGTPIYAAADGIVIVVRNSGWNGGYGRYSVISHENGTQTLYSHNSSNIVSIGQSVSQGQIIGYVGSTGESTGPHLHFEVRGAANPFKNCPVGRICAPQ